MKEKTSMPITAHLDKFIAGIGVLAAGSAMNNHGHGSSQRPHYNDRMPPDDGEPPPEIQQQAVSKLWVKIIIGIALGGWSVAILVGAGFGHWFLVGIDENRKANTEQNQVISSQLKELFTSITGHNGICERLTTVETNQVQVMKDKEEIWHHINDLEKQRHQ